METVLIRALTPYDTVLASTHGVMLKKHILCYAGPFAALCNVNNDCDVPVEAFQKHIYEMVSSPVPLSTVDIDFTKIYCVATYYCDFIRKTLDYDLQDLYFGSESSAERLPSRNFSLLLLFSVDKSCQNITDILYEFYDYLAPLNRKMIGNSVIIYSTPFRNLFLFNSQNNGIICNVFGRNNCLFLTDAKLSSGCEGAPVYSIDGELFGAVANVFTWCKGEWMGFTLAVHYYPVLKAWLNIEEKNSIANIRELSISESTFVKDIDSFGVVLISGSGIWGSGVVFDVRSGLILTCSHVVSYSTRTNIIVEYKRKKYHNAKILYATAENSPYDLAVIEVPPSNFKDCAEFKTPLSDSSRGEQVYVIGYPLFSFKNRTIQGPSVTYGHIAKIYAGAMMIAACASNSGSSGGALIKKTGELVGIVSNNLKVQDTLIPHTTVAIPTSAFLGPLKDYIRTNDANHLNRLTSGDDRVKRLWKLENRSKL